MHNSVDCFSRDIVMRVRQFDNDTDLNACFSGVTIPTSFAHERLFKPCMWSTMAREREAIYSAIGAYDY